jgi:hypothetical protein
MSTCNKYMEEHFGDEWRNTLKEGRCWIIQDGISNPYSGRGLDLICLAHDCEFNIATERGDWNVPHPSVCPAGNRRKLN